MLRASQSRPPSPPHSRAPRQKRVFATPLAGEAGEECRKSSPGNTGQVKETLRLRFPDLRWGRRRDEQGGNNLGGQGGREGCGRRGEVLPSGGRGEASQEPPLPGILCGGRESEVLSEHNAPSEPRGEGILSPHLALCCPWGNGLLSSEGPGMVAGPLGDKEVVRQWPRVLSCPLCRLHQSQPDVGKGSVKPSGVGERKTGRVGSEVGGTWEREEEGGSFPSAPIPSPPVMGCGAGPR